MCLFRKRGTRKETPSKTYPPAVRRISFFCAHTFHSSQRATTSGQVSVGSPVPGKDVHRGERRTSTFLPTPPITSLITCPNSLSIHDMIAKTAATCLVLAASVAAQTATITIEASHGGAGNGLTNTTIEVPLKTRYTNPALDAVSTLYLTAAEGVNLDSITCTPYRYNNLTGAGGLPFTSTTPSFLSTNTVQVGSLLCNTTSDTSSTSTTASVTSTLSASTSNLSITTNANVVPMTTTGRNLTSVYLTTVSPTHAAPSTVTSVAVFTGDNGLTTSTFISVVDGASPTSSAAPSLNSESAAAGVSLRQWFAQGAAMVGAALVAAL